MLRFGYRAKAPSAKAEHIDAEIVRKMRCRKCGGHMRYEPWVNGNSYVALAVCRDCGNEVEF